MIVCNNVVKRFQQKIAVNEVSFEVSGGICCLLGPNGAGKSTLLKILTGLLPPDKGTISIGGLDLAKDAVEVKRRIGVLPEELGLFDELTIEEHLELVAPIYGISREDLQIRSTDLLRLLGMEGMRRTLIRESSYGMRKKTALALALVHGPRALFLDEPFEGLDPMSSRAVQEVLRDAVKKGVTVFLTSHQLPLVEKLATRVMLVKNGRLVWDRGLDEGLLGLERPLEEIYFEHVKGVQGRELSWLGR
jgi:ABC-2 type transport system ATP-binding protein